MTETTARPGRPKKAPDEQRSDSLPAVRVTAAERAHIEAKAAAAGLSLSDYCRQVALSRRVKPATPATDAAALVALNRVGVLLNQIAKRMNAGQAAPPHLADLLDETRAAIVQVARRGA